MNKSAMTKFFIFWWFFCVIIVLGTIVLVTLSIFSREIDTRTYEADILYNRIMECITENGYLIEGLHEKSSWDIFSLCDISNYSFEVEPIFYIEISISESLKFSAGDKSLKDPCLLSLNKDFQKSFSKNCLLRSETVYLANIIWEEGLEEVIFNQSDLSLLVVSNQFIKNTRDSDE